MCGRFSQTDSLDIIAENFSIDEILTNQAPGYNIAPGSNIAAIIIKENRLLLVDFKWGFVPSWSKSPSIGNKMINARAETITEKPSFKNAIKSRRCLIVASGFYEWEKKENEKLPVYIQLKDRSTFGFAGLYETWQSPDGKKLNTCTIITTESNNLLIPIHGRMPVIIPQEDGKRWLSKPESQFPTILQMLKPYPSELMKWHYVSKKVNSPANNSPKCIEPV